METHRVHEDASVYFVTYSVVEWLPVFVSESACRIITGSLAFCRAQKGLRVNAYVIMPRRLHGILFDHEYDAARLAETLTSFRKYTARALLDFAAQHLPRTSWGQYAVYETAIGTFEGESPSAYRTGSQG